MATTASPALSDHSRALRGAVSSSPVIELLLNPDLYDPQPRGPSHLLVAGERVVWRGTAAFIAPEDTFEVLGGGALTVVDPSELEFSSMAHVRKNDPVCLIGLRLHVLDHGSTFNIRTREAAAARSEQLNASTEEISSSAAHQADPAERLLEATGRFSLGESAVPPPAPARGETEIRAPSATTAVQPA